MKTKVFAAALVFLFLVSFPLYSEDVKIRVSCRIPATFEVTQPDNVVLYAASSTTSKTKEPLMQRITGKKKSNKFVESVEEKREGNKRVIVYSVVSQ